MTGERGLIGTFLKTRLEGEGHNVIFTCDIRNGKDIVNINSFNLPEGKIDLMIHMAAHCKINQSISNPKKTFHTNVKGTFEVFEFCRKNNIPKIMYFSSSRVLSPERNPYTASKLYGEELCRGYKDCYGIDYMIVRPSTVYGPMWDGTKRLVHLFVVNALQNKPLEIYGNPENKTLDFTYVGDFVDAIMLTLSGEWNKEYNISGGEEYNLYKLAKKIIEITDSKSEILVKDAETAQPQVVGVDNSEIGKLGYLPSVCVDKGIEKCIEFYTRYLEKNFN